LVRRRFRRSVVSKLGDRRARSEPAKLASTFTRATARTVGSHFRQLGGNSVDPAWQGLGRVLVFGDAAFVVLAIAQLGLDMSRALAADRPTA